MKIYLAGERSAIATTAAIRQHGDDAAAALWATRVKRRLFSFPYHGFADRSFTRDPETGLSTAIVDAQVRGWDLFLDSGAFTANQQDVYIPWWEYADYVKDTRGIFAAVSSLDTIGAGERAAQVSYKTFRKLRDAGAQVLPVWHVRDPPRWLQRYLDEGEGYILIGGMVPETTDWLRYKLDQMWSVHLTNPDGTPRVKVHGFGMTTLELMRRYPWYSVDSTSWLAPGINGCCVFRVNDELQKVVFSARSERRGTDWYYWALPTQMQREVDSWLEPYGVTALQVTEHYAYRDVVNAAVFQNLEDFSTDRLALSGC